MFSDRMFEGFATAFAVFLVLVAVGGWALIEGIIWLYHHLTIGIR